jgi:hypothetical protein
LLVFWRVYSLTLGTRDEPAASSAEASRDSRATADGHDIINLLVIPPGTAAVSAQAAMDTATTSLDSSDDILAAAQQAPA